MAHGFFAVSAAPYGMEELKQSVRKLACPNQPAGFPGDF
jgi:hypothetical protein